MSDERAIEFRLRSRSARRTAGIVVVLGLVLVWAIAFFANHDTRFVCERHGHDGTCELRKRYPVGERDRSYALDDVRDVITRQRSTKNGARWDVVVEADGDSIDIDTYDAQPPAELEASDLRSFLRDARRTSFTTPGDAGPPSLSLSVLVGTPITLMLLLIGGLILQSATVSIDERRRVIRVVRHAFFLRRTHEVPLDEVAAVKVENSNVALKRGSMPVSNAWLVRADGTHVIAVHSDWATRGICDEPAQRLDAWIRSTSRAPTNVTAGNIAAAPIDGSYRAPPRHETELESLVAHPAPRDAAFAEPYARKLEPSSSFIGWGLVFGYLSLCAFTGVSILGTIGAMAALGRPPPPPGSLLLAMFVVGLAAFVGVWWLFVRLVRSRRARAAHLYTHGTLVDGAFARFGRMREGETFISGSTNVVFSPSPGVTRTATLVLGGQFAIAGGERCAVLFEPSYNRVVAYPLEGAAKGTIASGRLL